MNTTMKMSPDKILATIVSVIVIAAVIGGIFFVGSPQRRRAARIDDQRSSHLQSIASYVSDEYRSDNAVPATLDGMRENPDAYYASVVADPISGEPYTYEPLTDSTFRLCATFDNDTTDETASAPADRSLTPAVKYGDMRGDFYRHPSGRHCYDLDARILAPFVSCSLRNPCQEGSTCAQLPNEASAVCVPSGYECQAAGCADSCLIAESYPAQVRCTDASSMGEPKLPGGECTLMRNTVTNEMNCFGCANGICTDPTPNDVPYSQPEGEMGIPYACYASESGCALAQ